MNSTKNYYIDRLPALMHDFDRDARKLRSVLECFMGEEGVESLVSQTRKEYKELIYELPFIGCTDPLTRILINATLCLAIYRVATAHGKEVEEVGEMIYEISKAYLKAYPTFLTRFMGRRNFTKKYQVKLRKRAAESRLRQYPEGYVYDYIEGDGVTFDYGVDYIECASCKFFAKKGASEFAPYLCPVDILYSYALGWGLKRTKTLAQGDTVCNFRFKKGGKTQVAVPESMINVVAQSKVLWP